jgi:hypothetical protein
MYNERISKLILKELPHSSIVIQHHAYTLSHSCISADLQAESFLDILRPCSFTRQEWVELSALAKKNKGLRGPYFKIGSVDNQGNCDSETILGGYSEIDANIVKRDGTADAHAIDRPCCYIIDGVCCSQVTNEGRFIARNNRRLSIVEILELHPAIKSFSVPDKDVHYKYQWRGRSIPTDTAIPSSSIVDAIALDNHAVLLVAYDSDGSPGLALVCISLHTRDLKSISISRYADYDLHTLIPPTNKPNTPRNYFGLANNNSYVVYTLENQDKGDAKITTERKMVDKLSKLTSPHTSIYYGSNGKISEAHSLFSNAYDAIRNWRVMLANVDDKWVIRGTTTTLPGGKIKASVRSYGEYVGCRVDWRHQTQRAMIVFTSVYYLVAVVPAGEKFMIRTQPDGEIKLYIDGVRRKNVFRRYNYDDN